MAKFELTKDSSGEFRWRLRAENGQTIADSAEGYKDKSDALRGIELVKKEAPDAPVEDQT